MKSTTSSAHVPAKNVVLEAKSILRQSIPTHSVVSASLEPFQLTLINARFVPTELSLFQMEPLNASAVSAAGNQIQLAQIVSNVCLVFTRLMDQLVSLVPSTRSPPDSAPASAFLAEKVMESIQQQLIPTHSALHAVLVAILQAVVVSNVLMEP